MPPKNSIKVYQAGGYYHIYNRGVEKRNIFLDDKDYKVFLSYLKVYLRGPTPKVPPSHILRNYAGEMDLLCYCLMPNHFHLLVQQKSDRVIAEFIRSLTVRYTMYFNKRNDRVGGLFQGKYKAVRVSSEEQLVYLTKYIHLNPKEKGLVNYSYFSLPNYLGKIMQDWVKPRKILYYFSNSFPGMDYRSFVFDQEGNFGVINRLLIDT